MKEIRDWLTTKGPYAAGVALYETHGKSRVVLKSLRYGESEFTRATLRRELEKIVSSPDTENVRVNVRADVRVKSVRAVDTSAERVRETPNRVQVVPDALSEQRRTWYATRAYAHAQLELVGDAERRRLAVDILELTEKIDGSYRPAELAEAPLPPPDLPTEPGEIRRQLTNARALASKLKKNPDRASDLARVKTTITQLEVKLKRDGEPQLHPRH